MNDRILLVDDEANVLSALKRALFDEPLEIVSVTRVLLEEFFVFPDIPENEIRGMLMECEIEAEHV
jgi:hypothetical protein